MDEVALRLRVTRRTVQHRIAKGKIQVVQPGGPGTAVRISATELDRLMGRLPRSY